MRPWILYVLGAALIVSGFLVDGLVDAEWSRYARSGLIGGGAALIVVTLISRRRDKREAAQRARK